MTALIVVTFVVILLIACGLTWFVTQTRATKRLRADRDEKWAMFDQARKDWWERLDKVEAENASLKKRNNMLSGLVGADAERAALQGSAADEARWVV